MKAHRGILVVLFLLIAASGLYAQTSETASDSMTAQMTLLVLQLAVLIFAVKAGGTLAKKIHMPSVVGELLAGVVIGPYALGSIGLPGFAHGIFPVAGNFAVTPILYGFSTVASIILLFSSGLETDLNLFLRYSVAGGVVGLGGVLASFALGSGLGVLVTGQPFFSATNMFLGIMSTATSVGITARILSDRKKMDSPEGVTILAAAVFDDVLGIVCLALVMGVTAAMTGHKGGLSGWGIAGIAIKAFGIWLGFTALGLVFGQKIAGWLKKSGGQSSYSVLALGLALLLAGFFETQGLAMIIGAYIIGISLSKTDLSYKIQETTRPLYDFFVPVFFAVMGMLVDVTQFLKPEVLGFGLAYTGVAILAKMIGCGLPPLFMGFNLRGATRIGIGMMPRGEVALIIAGIGLSSGILAPSAFGVAILMTMITSIVAPPALSAVVSKGGPGTKKAVKGSDTTTVRLDFPSKAISDLVADGWLRDMEREGFLVQLMSIQDDISHIRKDTVAISLLQEETALMLECAPEDVSLVKSSLYETVMKLDSEFEKLKNGFDISSLRENLADSSARKDGTFRKLLAENCVTVSLKGPDKESAIRQLVNILDKAGKLTDKNSVTKDILAREALMSTGMQHSIAMPHARTTGIQNPAIALGIAPVGIDFQNIDDTLARIVALVASPADNEAPHMQALASLGSVLGDESIREKLLAARDEKELWAVLTSVSK